MGPQRIMAISAVGAKSAEEGRGDGSKNSWEKADKYWGVDWRGGGELEYVVAICAHGRYAALSTTLEWCMAEKGLVLSHCLQWSGDGLNIMVTNA